MGSYELRDLDHPGRGYLYEGKLIIDKTWGHGYYGCAGCCGASRAQMNPDPLGGPITTGAWNAAQAYETCEDLWVDYTDQATGWASANTGVVTLSNAYSNFVGIGGTTGSADLALEGNIERNGVCLTKYFQPHSTQNTVPSISWTNGPVITTTQNVVIGQEIALTGNPGGGTWSIVQPSPAWIAGFNESNGHPETLVAASGTNVLFYWAGPGNNTVSYAVAGASSSANFSVSAPTVTVRPTPGTDIYLTNDGTNVGANCGDETSTWCMTLDPTVGQAGGVSGTTEWIQVVDNLNVTYTPTGGGSQVSCNEPPPLPGLDGQNPYTTAAQFIDAPGEGWPEAKIVGYNFAFSFSAVLMWHPNVTYWTWIPISSTNWGWGATLTLYNGTWGISQIASPWTQVLYGTQYWPEWYSIITNGEQPSSCS